MKRFLLILTLALFAGFSVKAQDGGEDKIRDKMREFIQRRLNLSKNEAERFTPVFIRYFKEWRDAIRENRGDVLERQKKIVDLRIRYRTEFREIVGERKSNEIYKQQDIFVDEVTKIRRDQIRERRDNLPRNRSILRE